MKKSIILGILLISLILFTNLIIAEEVIGTENTGIQQVTEISGANDFKASTNQFLANEITIPENMNTISRLLFGIKEGETLEFSTLIILIALWLLGVIIIQAGLEFAPFFEGKLTSWLGAIIITLMASTTGIMNDASVFIFGLKDLFGNLGNYSFFFLILIIIVIIFLMIGGKELFHILKHKLKKQVKEEKGFEEGAGI